MNRLATLGFAVALLVGIPSNSQAASQQEWQDFIDGVAAGAGAAANVAAGELLLPPGVSDVVSALANSPDMVKTGLQFWLRSKMQSAVLDDDMVRLDRYQAFYSCLSTRDCSKVRELTSSAHAAEAGNRVSSFEPGQNRFGGDYSHYAMDNADPKVCEISCVSDHQCQAWTYVRPGIQDDTHAVCWLKDSVPDLSDNACCTSGKIEQTPEASSF